jgi:hypothetical protein
MRPRSEGREPEGPVTVDARDSCGACCAVVVCASGAQCQCASGSLGRGACSVTVFVVGDTRSTGFVTAWQPRARRGLQ